MLGDHFMSELDGSGLVEFQASEVFGPFPEDPQLTYERVTSTTRMIPGWDEAEQRPIPGTRVVIDHAYDIDTCGDVDLQLRWANESILAGLRALSDPPARACLWGNGQVVRLVSFRQGLSLEPNPVPRHPGNYKPVVRLHAQGTFANASGS